MKIVVAADSFKGCLTSLQVGEAVREGLLLRFPDAEIRVLAMADGGEGTMDALCRCRGGERRSVVVCAPDRTPVEGEYAIIDGNTGIVEFAQSSGLTLLADGKRDVMHATSYGFGMLIREAVKGGCRDIVCTLGGSATNDAALGALQALGLKIYDENGEITEPVTAGHLHRITGFDISPLRELQRDVRFRFLYDADIDFSGAKGAAMMYAAQKGATPQQRESLDREMRRLRELMEYAAGSAIPRGEHIPGEGAAGGAGLSLALFLGATPVRGTDAVLDALRFDEEIRDASLVITGEGHADAQTNQGKTPVGVLGRAGKRDVPVVLVAGRVSDREGLERAGFSEIIDINDAPALPEGEDPLDPGVAFRRISGAMLRMETLRGDKGEKGREKRRREKKRGILNWIIVGVVAAVVTAVYGVLDPADAVAGGYFPKCAVKMLTGLDCPSCGVQRALHAFLRGDISGAIRSNYFLLIAVPYLLALAVTGNRDMRTSRWRRFFWGKWGCVVFVTLYIAWFVVRNILKI